MIKHILKTITYCLLALGLTQFLLMPFDFGSGGYRNALLLALALFILFFVLHPILKLLSFADSGIAFILINSILTFIVLYIASSFLPTLKINEIDLSQLLIVGFMLPSTKLSSLWTAVVSAILITLIYRYLSWLSKKR